MPRLVGGEEEEEEEGEGSKDRGTVMAPSQPPIADLEGMRVRCCWLQGLFTVEVSQREMAFVQKSDRLVLHCAPCLAARLSLFGQSVPSQEGRDMCFPFFLVLS